VRHGFLLAHFVILKRRSHDSAHGSFAPLRMTNETGPYDNETGHNRRGCQDRSLRSEHSFAYEEPVRNVLSAMIRLPFSDIDRISILYSIPGLRNCGGTLSRLLEPESVMSRT
jgi:hypothetical protein